MRLNASKLTFNFNGLKEKEELDRKNTSFKFKRVKNAFDKNKNGKKIIKTRKLFKNSYSLRPLDTLLVNPSSFKM